MESRTSRWLSESREPSQKIERTTERILEAAAISLVVPRRAGRKLEAFSRGSLSLSVPSESSGLGFPLQTVCGSSALLTRSRSTSKVARANVVVERKANVTAFVFIVGSGPRSHTALASTRASSSQSLSSFSARAAKDSSGSKAEGGRRERVREVGPLLCFKTEKHESRIKPTSDERDGAGPSGAQVKGCWSAGVRGEGRTREGQSPSSPPLSLPSFFDLSTATCPQLISRSSGLFSRRLASLSTHLDHHVSLV